MMEHIFIAQREGKSFRTCRKCGMSTVYVSNFGAVCTVADEDFSALGSVYHCTCKQKIHTNRCMRRNYAWVTAPETKLIDAITTNVDSFGEWAETMWFSGGQTETDRSMGERDLSIMGLGIAGEAGEVVEKIKKDIRDHFVDKEAILKELGDVIFYAFMIARYYGFKPSEILQANYEKLTSRKARGVERGSGDNR